MIRGIYDPSKGVLIPLVIRGSDGADIDANAVLDTGFTGTLTLPHSLAEGLGLKAGPRIDLVLADGSVQSLESYTAEVNWDGHWRPVLASAIGDQVLVGMRLLNGFRLRIDVIPGGVVEITSLLLS